MASEVKKIKVWLELLIDINMLLFIEEGISGGISPTIHWYEGANDKYIKAFDKNKDTLYLMYWDSNNLYSWAMSRM